jgi:hypothetical protein
MADETQATETLEKAAAVLDAEAIAAIEAEPIPFNIEDLFAVTKHPDGSMSIGIKPGIHITDGVMMLLQQVAKEYTAVAQTNIVLQNMVNAYKSGLESITKVAVQVAQGVDANIDSILNQGKAVEQQSNPA